TTWLSATGQPRSGFRDAAYVSRARFSRRRWRRWSAERRSRRDVPRGGGTSSGEIAGSWKPWSRHVSADVANGSDTAVLMTRHLLPGRVHGALAAAAGRRAVAQQVLVGAVLGHLAALEEDDAVGVVEPQRGDG